jgi:hypothetical protein
LFLFFFFCSNLILSKDPPALVSVAKSPAQSAQLRRASNTLGIHDDQHLNMQRIHQRLLEQKQQQLLPKAVPDADYDDHHDEPIADVVDAVDPEDADYMPEELPIATRRSPSPLPVSSPPPPPPPPVPRRVSFATGLGVQLVEEQQAEWAATKNDMAARRGISVKDPSRGAKIAALPPQDDPASSQLKVQVCACACRCGFCLVPMVFCARTTWCGFSRSLRAKSCASLRCCCEHSARASRFQSLALNSSSCLGASEHISFLVGGERRVTLLLK